MEEKWLIRMLLVLALFFPYNNCWKLNKFQKFHNLLQSRRRAAITNNIGLLNPTESDLNKHVQNFESLLITNRIHVSSNICGNQINLNVLDYPNTCINMSFNEVTENSDENYHNQFSTAYLERNILPFMNPISKNLLIAHMSKLHSLPLAPSRNNYILKISTSKLLNRLQQSSKVACNILLSKLARCGVQWDNIGLGVSVDNLDMGLAFQFYAFPNHMMKLEAYYNETSQYLDLICATECSLPLFAPRDTTIERSTVTVTVGPLCTVPTSPTPSYVFEELATNVLSSLPLDIVSKDSKEHIVNLENIGQSQISDGNGDGDADVDGNNRHVDGNNRHVDGNNRHVDGGVSAISGIEDSSRNHIDSPSSVEPPHDTVESSRTAASTTSAQFSSNTGTTKEDHSNPKSAEMMMTPKEKSLKELQDLFENTRKVSKFLNVLKDTDKEIMQFNNVTESDVNITPKLSLEKMLKNATENNYILNNETTIQNKNRRDKLSELHTYLQRPLEVKEDVSRPVTLMSSLQVDSDVESMDHARSIDDETVTTRHSTNTTSNDRHSSANSNNSNISNTLPLSTDTCWDENQFAKIDKHSDSYKRDKSTLELLINELSRCISEDMHDAILDGFKDLMLSDDLVFLLHDANSTCLDTKVRGLYSKIAYKSASLVTQLVALVKSESLIHLDTINKICKVASEFQQNEDTFIEEMNKLKCKFDTNLLNYIQYAMKEEEKNMDRAKRNNNKVESESWIKDANGIARSEWWHVLSVVYKGVFADFEYRYETLLDMLWLTIRFPQDNIRSELFKRFVDITETLDLPALKQLALNTVDYIRAEPISSLASTAEFIDGTELKRRCLALEKDVALYLSDESIVNKLNEYKSKAQLQNIEIVENHRNPRYNE